MVYNEIKREFLAEIRRRGYSERTVRGYSFDLDKFEFYLNKIAELPSEKLDVKDIDYMLLQDWVDYELERGKLKLKTLARRVATLRSLFKFLYKSNYIGENPTEKISIPKTPKKIPSVLTQNEVRELINIIDNEWKNNLRDRAIIILLYSTGIRVSEVVGLKVSNFNIEGNYIKIFGKGAKERNVPLSQVTKKVLLEYLSEREKKGKGVSPRSPLFVRENGLAMTVRMIQYLVEKAGRKAGLRQHVFPHLLRHSIATHMIEEGSSVEAVRRTLGHEDLSTTSIYLKTSTKFLQDEHRKYNPTDRILSSNFKKKME